MPLNSCTTGEFINHHDCKARGIIKCFLPCLRNNMNIVLIHDVYNCALETSRGVDIHGFGNTKYVLQ